MSKNWKLIHIKSKQRRFKIDTDKFELVWHASMTNDNERTFMRSVWETPTCVGPGAYNAGHIDYVRENAKNDLSLIVRLDDGEGVCRRKLDKMFIKFNP